MNSGCFGRVQGHLFCWTKNQIGNFLFGSEKKQTCIILPTSHTGHWFWISSAWTVSDTVTACVKLKWNYGMQFFSPLSTHVLNTDGVYISVKALSDLSLRWCITISMCGPEARQLILLSPCSWPHPSPLLDGWGFSRLYQSTASFYSPVTLHT